MREAARFEGNSYCNGSNMESNKGNFSRLPIILCAVAGILIGGLAFRAAYGNINISDLKIGAQSGSQAEKTDSFGVIKDIIFQAFGMDRYNPITILNSNSTFFEEYYKNDYLKFIAEKEQQKLEEQIVSIDEVHDDPPKTSVEPAEASPESTVSSGTGALKEVSSSITFESDVDSSDQLKNPTVTNGKIKVVNETKYNIDINKLLKEPLKLNPVKTGPQIFVYHTHTTESFLRNVSQLNNSANVPSRTTDSNYNVVRVGDALINNLKKFKINVLHNTTIHDKDYNSSYVKSLGTLTNYVEKYPSLKMTIDLHRDAAGDDKLRVAKKINGKDYAQIMFVIGTDSKLSNPKWRENLKLALKLQSRLNEIAPGIAKPTYISKNRYNQHLTNGSVIIEIGGDGNVIDECVRSTGYLAQAINDVIYKNKY
ncbi:MAG: stage sporulation protein [Eubacterium sp.]|nr:stage sporulation protein [Eubacterium sp.]